MEVKIRYLTDEIAKSFGANQKVEVVQLPDGAKFNDLLDLFRRKYEQNNPKSGHKIEDDILGMFIFICEGKNLRRVKNELINPEKEVLVGFADTGG